MNGPESESDHARAQGEAGVVHTTNSSGCGHYPEPDRRYAHPGAPVRRRRDDHYQANASTILAIVDVERERHAHDLYEMRARLNEARAQTRQDAEYISRILGRWNECGQQLTKLRGEVVELRGAAEVAKQELEAAVRERDELRNELAGLQAELEFLRTRKAATATKSRRRGR